MAQWKGWRAADMPDLHGRVALVTGASSGIGLETAAQLARGGARTLLGCRDPQLGARARELVTQRFPGAAVEVVRMDLASLESVEDAAEEIADRAGQLDVLVNNTELVAPAPELTAEGFELQLGVNHLGHFALTGRLLPLLLAADAARVVTVSSLGHRLWTGAGLAEPLDFKTLPGRSRWLGYFRSKLANVLFALELERRTRACSATLRSIAAVGTLPSLYAATNPSALGGEFIGPRLAVRGAPVRIKPSHAARDAKLADQLWRASVEATGVGYEELYCVKA